MNEQSTSTIKTRSREGMLVDRVDNPDKARRVNMQVTESDIKAVESEPEKETMSVTGDLQEKLATYNNHMTMQAVLECLTNEQATKTTAKDQIIKAWKKTKRNMESTENSVREKSDELLGEIELARTASNPDEESVGLIKARVVRAVEEIRDSQKDVKKGKLSLVDLISDQDTDDDLTENMLETLRRVTEKETDRLQNRLEKMSLRLENAVKAIKDLTNSPTKFQEDKRNAPEQLQMNAAEKHWCSYSNWRKGMDRYVSDCYKGDTNAKKKVQCVRPAMTICWLT